MRYSAVTLSLAILGLVSAAATAAPVRRAGFADARHVDQVARNIEQQANQIMRFVRLNFYHYGQCLYGGQSQHLINDARAIAKAARHIHDVAHRSSGRPFEVRHIRRDVVELDRLVHHVQDLAARMNRRPRATARGGGLLGRLVRTAFRPTRNGHGMGGHGVGGGFGHGGNAWALTQLQRRLQRLSQSVHHLMKDVNVPCGF